MIFGSRTFLVSITTTQILSYIIHKTALFPHLPNLMLAMLKPFEAIHLLGNNTLNLVLQ